MPEYGIWAAAALALIPALMGSGTAWALLASLAYVYTLEALGVPFGLVWFLADAFVLRTVLRPNMTLQDELIVVLFLPAWWSYSQDAVMLYEVATGVVILQLLICIPWLKFQRTIYSISHGSLRAGSLREVFNGGKH